MKVDGIREIQPVETVRPVTIGLGGDPANAAVTGAAGAEKGFKDDIKDIRSVEKAIEIINKTMENYSTEIQFTLHKKSGEYIVKVINTSDNSVIREVPPKRVLDMVAHFKEMLGLIVDKFI